MANTPSPKMRYLLDAIREHAVANYTKDGWDYVVESYSDEELVEAIRHDMWTKKQAIAIVASHVAPLAAHRAEIEATAF